MLFERQTRDTPPLILGSEKHKKMDVGCACRKMTSGIHMDKRMAFMREEI